MRLDGYTDGDLRGSKELDLRVLEEGQVAVDNQDLARLASLGLTSLETLNINGELVTGDGLANVGKITSLKTLFMTCQSLTDADICHLRTLTNLEVLILQHAPGVTGTNFDRLAAAQLPLKQIVLASSGITDEGLACIANNFPDLDVISVATSKVTDNGLAHLSKFKKLGRVIIGGPEISDASIQHLKKLAVAPRIIMISRNSQLTPEGKAELQVAFPRCTISA